MEEMQTILGYTFQDVSLLKTALTHSSFANEKHGRGPCNERLEFLGDSVLSIVVSDFLYRHNPDMPEGELTKLRASLVCEKSLCEYAKSLEFPRFLLLGKGETMTGGAFRPSILADAFEAVLAAIYLDGGMEAARTYLMRVMKKDLTLRKPKVFKDYKTILQEIVQQNPEETVQYVVTGESGPDHHKHFVVEVHLNSNCIGKGGGPSKKAAEQEAARQALALMGY